MDRYGISRFQDGAAEETPQAVVGIHDLKRILFGASKIEVPLLLPAVAAERVAV